MTLSELRLMATATQQFRGESKRAEVVALRLQGKTLNDIAKATGLAGDSSVRYHLDAWLAEQRPTAEQTEELRQLQASQIDALFDGLWPQRDDVAVVDRLVKLMDRKARLMGLDLQQGISVTVVTAEALASYLGWDAEPEAIEGVATEITDITDGA
jgi:hypothetical protein